VASAARLRPSRVEGLPLSPTRNITGSLAKSGSVYKYDVSIPLSELYDLVEEMRPRVRPLGAEVSGFGHLGDGNLHLQLVGRAPGLLG
jgi:FAD/FMN-containing dehydrogenase